MKTLCLVMIVRNEAKVIIRCLDSVRGMVNHWVVCDTGSTDGTQDLVRDYLNGIPGTLHQVEWMGFGYNRSEALKLAKGKADYHLLIDADMTVNVVRDFRDNLELDSYLLRHEGDLEYWVDRVVSDRHVWRYIGLTHEYIWSETAKTRGKLGELSVTHFEDGGSRADKFQRDIQLLKRELETDPKNSRNVFYMAQSYRDIGNLAQAMEWYEKRTSMGGWEEETWYSLYQVARLQHRMGMLWPIVLNSYLTAYEFRPTRIEPLYYVAKFYRENKEYDLGLLFSRAAVGLTYTEDILFVEKIVYRRDVRLEYAACCEGLGMNDEAARVRDALAAEMEVDGQCKDAAKGS